METLNRVHIKHPDLDVEANLRVSYDADASAHDGLFLKTATLVVETGACNVQVYVTADTLREMAALLTEAANAVDAGVAAAQTIAEAA